MEVAMCMFCAALPMVAGVTAVAQGEQRKKIQAAETRQQAALDTTLTPENQVPRPIEPASPRHEQIWLTPRRITQMGALAFVLLLFGSGFYHTHFPG